jgi:hypothetical protein
MLMGAKTMKPARRIYLYGVGIASGLAGAIAAAVGLLKNIDELVASKAAGWMTWSWHLMGPELMVGIAGIIGMLAIRRSIAAGWRHVYGTISSARQGRPVAVCVCVACALLIGLTSFAALPMANSYYKTKREIFRDVALSFQNVASDLVKQDDFVTADDILKKCLAIRPNSSRCLRSEHKISVATDIQQSFLAEYYPLRDGDVNKFCYLQVLANLHIKDFSVDSELKRIQQGYTAAIAELRDGLVAASQGDRTRAEQKFGRCAAYSPRLGFCGDLQSELSSSSARPERSWLAKNLGSYTVEQLLEFDGYQRLPDDIGAVLEECDTSYY